MYKNIFIFALILIPTTSFAQWDDCPFGETDSSCESPGQCRRYTDTDENEICDHSQPEPETSLISNDSSFDEHDVITGKELKAKTVKEVSVLYNINEIEYAKLIGDYLNTKVSIQTSFQTLHDNYDLEPSKAKDIALSLRDSKQNIATVDKLAQSINAYSSKPRYPLRFLVVVTVFAYGATYFLVKQKFITMLTHRKIWNMVLMINFLISAILGILLVFQINWGTRFGLSFDILYWHVITGIIMAIVCIFHIAWHWRYYKNLFKKN